MNPYQSSASGIDESRANPGLKIIDGGLPSPYFSVGLGVLLILCSVPGMFAYSATAPLWQRLSPWFMAGSGALNLFVPLAGRWATRHRVMKAGPVLAEALRAGLASRLTPDRPHSGVLILTATELIFSGSRGGPETRYPLVEMNRALREVKSSKQHLYFSLPDTDELLRFAVSNPKVWKEAIRELAAAAG